MSFEYHFKKSVAAVFNTKSVLKAALVSTATVLTPVYMAAEMVLSDASAVRTSGIGDRQAETLDKNLTSLLTFTRDAQGKMGELNAMRQQQIVEAGNEALAEKVRAREEEQEAVARMLGEKKYAFTSSLLTSEGISEVDAKNLIGRYQGVFGIKDLQATRGSGAVGNHAFSYLDECQKEILGGTVYQSRNTAESIDQCMYRSADSHSLGSFMAGLVGGLPAGLALFFLTSVLGRRYQRETENEDYRRQVERSPSMSDNIKTDEVSLKIKIQKPRL